MEAWSTRCSECDWEGCVRLEDIHRGCPRKGLNGLRCGAPFAGTPPAMTRFASKPFYRKMSEAEVGEMVLMREWSACPATWVKREDGRVMLCRPRPEGFSDAKVAALWDMLGRDPFPVHEGAAVSGLDGLNAVAAVAPQPSVSERAKERVKQTLAEMAAAVPSPLVVAGGQVAEPDLFDPAFWEE